MTQTETNQRLSKVRRKLVLSLAVNGLVPLVLYTLLRRLFPDDAPALAIAGSVPAVRTMSLWAWRRRVDWIGVLAVLGFVVALAISALSTGSDLLLKVHGSLWTGAIGLVFLISVVIGKPLLLPLLQVFMRNDPELSSALEKRASNPASQKRLTIITAVIGFVLIGDAVTHVILALTLPTEKFLITSRLVSWAILGTGAAFIWWIHRHVEESGGHVGKNH
jgi:hypothetical protein